MSQMNTGTVTGTGAALPVQVGFVPDALFIINMTTAGLVVWHKNMTADYSLTIKAAAVATSSQGITVLDGDEISGVVYNGFKMGTDCNAASDDILWFAFRE